MSRSFVYRNGNYIVSSTGWTLKKQCFRINEGFKPDFPDSIDLKISNRCSIGCPYCHEESIPNGKLADFNEIVKHLSSLPDKPIEVAIGGGDLVVDDESFLLLAELTKWLKSKNIKVSVTLNEKSLDSERFNELKELNLNGFGISLGPDITKDRLEYIDKITSYQYSTPTKVFHIILGLFPLDLLKDLLSHKLYLWSNRVRLLFLGYKQFGRAKQNELPNTIQTFESLIKRSILMRRESGTVVYPDFVFGFDNLALEQLSLEKAFIRQEFDNIFLGPEFSCSMYVDAVNGQYAESSTSRLDSRVSWDSIDILEYFKHDKTSKKD